MKILNQLEVWSYLFLDMKKPLSYLPRAILIGLAAAAAGCVLQHIYRRYGIKLHRSNHQKRTGSLYNIPALFLFAVYLTVLSEEAIFSRPPGSRTSVDLEFLGTWGHSSHGNAYVLENILMFFPLGVILPLLINPLKKKGWLCVLIGFMVSVSLETVQYLTQRGHCQLDDVVMNTLGAFAGWLTLYVITKIKR